MQHKSPMATLGLLVACLASMTWADALNNNPAERYVNKAPSRDGIGKYYLGREISHVMVDNSNLPSVLEEKECCPTCKSHESLVNVDESRRYENEAHSQWNQFYL